MSSIENLLRAWERQLAIPWEVGIAGPQKVWHVMYEPGQERRLRARLPQFKAKAGEHGHPWRHLDLTDAFADWMGNHEYREDYFLDPEYIDDALEEFTDAVIAKVIDALTADDVDNATIVALTGVASLFGLTYVSRVVGGADAHIRGRLAVFFPGEHEGSNYRLLDARDGWNYLALPISASNGG